jgi:hypothetical protein
LSRRRRFADLLARLDKAEHALREAADGIRESRELIGQDIGRVIP